MNKTGRLQGRGVNGHLNDTGMEQAEALGRFVANVPFDTVTSSSLHRAYEVRGGLLYARWTGDYGYARVLGVPVVSSRHCAVWNSAVQLGYLS